MSDHFNGKYEVEFKFRLPSLTVFKEKLFGLKPEVMLEDNLEHDVYFDTPDSALKAENKYLCIREMQPSGIMLWIVKGPEADRCEADNITDATKARSMLMTLWCLSVAKQRVNA